MRKDKILTAQGVKMSAILALRYTVVAVCDEMGDLDYEKMRVRGIAERIIGPKMFNPMELVLAFLHWLDGDRTPVYFFYDRSGTAPGPVVNLKPLSPNYDGYHNVLISEEDFVAHLLANDPVEGGENDHILISPTEDFMELELALREYLR